VFAEHTVVATHLLVKIEPQLPLPPSALLSCAIPTGNGSAAKPAGRPEVARIGPETTCVTLVSVDSNRAALSSVGRDSIRTC
jgi:Zn-dependent alcohol dehydrogenase